MAILKPRFLLSWYSLFLAKMEANTGSPRIAMLILINVLINQRKIFLFRKMMSNHPRYTEIINLSFRNKNNKYNTNATHIVICVALKLQ